MRLDNSSGQKQKSGGQVHSDIQRGLYVRRYFTGTISSIWVKLLRLKKSYSVLKERNMVKDGDIINFRFNV